MVQHCRPTARSSGFDSQVGSVGFLCRVSIFSPCLCGFILGTLICSHNHALGWLVNCSIDTLDPWVGERPATYFLSLSHSFCLIVFFSLSFSPQIVLYLRACLARSSGCTSFSQTPTDMQDDAPTIGRYVQSLLSDEDTPTAASGNPVVLYLELLQQLVSAVGGTAGGVVWESLSITLICFISLWWIYVLLRLWYRICLLFIINVIITTVIMFIPFINYAILLMINFLFISCTNFSY